MIFYDFTKFEVVCLSCSGVIEETLQHHKTFERFCPSLYIPPRDDESSHDDDEPPSPPRLLPPQPHDAPGGGPSGKGPQRRSERERKGTRKEGNIYPPGTSTDTDRRKHL